MTIAGVEYSALAAKAKAMYGKRLRAGDLRYIAALPSVDSVVDYLRRQPGWSRAADRLRNVGAPADREELERALREQAGADFARLLHFIPGRDKPLAAFPVLLSDLREIMSALRRLHSGAGRASAAPQLSPGGVDRERLASCGTFDGLLAAVRGSIYHAPLLRLHAALPGALPDYTAAEALLKSAYYTYIYRLIRQKYAGQTRAVLLKSFGQEADMLNLLHILRLKRFFPEEPVYTSALFPFRGRLRPAVLHALCAAPSVSAALRLLEETPYGPVFRGMSLREMELAYRRQIYRFHRRQLNLGAASVYTAVAYLNLKDLEIKTLIHAIESVHYGVPCSGVLLDLTGE